MLICQHGIVWLVNPTFDHSQPVNRPKCQKMKVTGLLSISESRQDWSRNRGNLDDKMNYFPKKKWKWYHTNPMHCPTQGQWWSKRSTQLLQMEQCEQRGGRYSMQVSQYLTLTGRPLTITSLVRGNWRLGVCRPPISADADVSYRNSSSGGCELRGTIPGSRDDVRSKSTSTYRVD